MEKGHNFPLFIGSMADGGRARFLHWTGKNWVGKEGSPKPLGNPKWKKGHNFPLFIGSMADGGRARFLHWAGKIGSERRVPPSPSGTQNGKKAIISPCLLPPASRGLRPIFIKGSNQPYRRTPGSAIVPLTFVRFLVVGVWAPIGAPLGHVPNWAPMGYLDPWVVNP